MNKVLSKCIEELKSEAPRLDYVLGMLETLMEMDEAPKNTVSPNAMTALPASADTEAAILDAHARAAVEAVKSFSVEG